MGQKARYWKGCILSEQALGGEYVSLPFTVSRGHQYSLACSLFLYLQSQQHDIFKSPCLFLSFIRTLVITQIVQGNTHLKIFNLVNPQSSFCPVRWHIYKSGRTFGKEFPYSVDHSNWLSTCLMNSRLLRSHDFKTCWKAREGWGGAS